MEEQRFIRFKEIVVAGTSYENRSTIMKKMSMDTKITLKKEEDNPHDKEAIAVYAEIEKVGIVKIGYIPKVHCKIIAKTLEKCALHHATICKLSKNKMGLKNGYDTTFYALTISLTFKNMDGLEVERARYLADINYNENRFYFKNVFLEELKERMAILEKQGTNHYLKAYQDYIYSVGSVTEYAHWDDFLSNVGLVKDLLNQIDCELVVNLKNNSKNLNLIYKGYPIRDSEIVSDLLFISNIDKEAATNMEDFDYFNEHFLKRDIC